jgi:hypothetical protein
LGRNVEAAQARRVKMRRMAAFKSYRSYQLFARSVESQWRYTKDNDQTDFLHTVLDTSVSRQEVIPAQGILWRAQIGQDCYPPTEGEQPDEAQPSPLPVDRMSPLADRAREGRANPKGIPYLYLDTHQETAVAEVRPWKGVAVSVGEFQLRRDVRIVNCTTDDHRIIIYAPSEPAPADREREVWSDIDRAFSRPVTPTDDTADYAPTQVLAEFFREKGLDGIAYRSSLGKGHNVALFEVGVASLRSCQLFEIDDIRLDYSMAANGYWTKD